MKFMESFIVSVGGSMVNPSGVDVQYVKNFTDILKSVDVEKRGIVVGGGANARNYVQAMSAFTKNDYFQDEIGIMATRMNAKIVQCAMGLTNYKIPETITDALQLVRLENTVVMGGSIPGHTTDTVSVILAEAMGIKKVYNLTSVDMVYTDDPKKNPDSKPIERINYKEAFGISLKSYRGAGSNQFMDSVSLLIAMRSEITINLMHGKDLENFKNAINGKKFKGTVIEL